MSPWFSPPPGSALTSSPRPRPIPRPASASASAAPIGAKSGLVGSLKSYELVAPTGITRGSSSSGTSEPFPESIAFTLRAFGEDFDVELERHDALFHADYREWTRESDGSKTETGSHPGRSHCHYRGRVRSPAGSDPRAPATSSSAVAVSVCDGVRGHIITRDRAIQLEPAHAHLHGHEREDAEDVLSSKLIAFRAEDRAESNPADRSRRPSAKPARFVDAGDAMAATMGSQDGVPRVDADIAREAMESRARGGGRGLLARRQVHLELLVVNDEARCAQFASGSSMTAAELAEMHGQTIHVVNLVASLYAGAFSWEFTVVLMGQEDWTTSEPISVAADRNGETDAEDLLDAFNAWRGANLGTLPDNDVAHLFSGRDFDGQTVGLAPQQGDLSASICDEREHCGMEWRRGRYLQPGECVESEAYGVRCCHHWAAGSISQVHKDDFGTSATTVAHEIGHQLGFQHDGEAGEAGDPTTQRGAACSEHGHIMAAIGTDGLVPTWSTCSKETYDETIQHFDCLRTGATAVCGNGIVDTGEECDCGPDGCDGVDPCCDGATCRLTAGSECSETQGCCTSCRVVAAGTTCRASTGFCDIAETCSGTSAECPADEAKPLGTACVEDNGDKGACWGTTCENRERSCQRWSSERHGGASASDSCRFSVEGVGPMNGPFTDTHCTGPLVCFDDATVCSSSRYYEYSTVRAARGFPCSTPVNGSYTHVCSGGVYGDGRLGSECVSVDTLTPEPPPPPLPPFPPAPPEPPPAPPWILSGRLGAIAENIELIGSLVAVVFFIFAVSALWKYCFSRKRQPVPVTRQVQMMPVGAAPQGWYPPPPGQAGAPMAQPMRGGQFPPQYQPPPQYAGQYAGQYAQQYPQNPQYYPQNPHYPQYPTR